MTVASSLGALGPVTLRRLVPRIQGALLGVSLTSLLAAIRHDGASAWQLGILDLAVVGLVVGAIVGWVSGPGALETGRPIRFAIARAIVADLGGIAIVSFVAIVHSITSQQGVPVVELFGWCVGLTLLGLLFATPITVPIALIAVGSLRTRGRWAMVPETVIATAFFAAGAVWFAASS